MGSNAGILVGGVARRAAELGAEVAGEWKYDLAIRLNFLKKLCRGFYRV